MNRKSSLPVAAADELPNEFALLRACLARVPDHRKSQGKLYA